MSDSADKVVLDLDKFDPTKIEDGSIIVMIGKKGTGKSTLVKDIFWHKRYIPDGIAMLGTLDANDDFSGMIPDLFMFNGYHKDKLKDFIARQRKLNKERKERGLPKKYAFVLIDDCGYDADFTKDPLLRLIFMNGRHFGIFFIFTLQYCMEMKPAIRSQIDYVFILRENILSNQHRLHKEFCGIIEDFSLFRKILEKTTDQRKCLVVKNNCVSNKIQDVLFWYKAELRPKFRVGSNEYWHYHLMHYNPKHDDDDDNLNHMENEIQWEKAKKATAKKKICREVE